jgi:hypothetical protein
MPDWGSEGDRLSPCLRLPALIPETLSEAQIKRLEEISSTNGTVYNHTGLLSLPSSSTSASSTPRRRIRLPLLVPRATTKQILRGCRGIAPGVSVTHVLLSAVALALSELQLQALHSKHAEMKGMQQFCHWLVNKAKICKKSVHRDEPGQIVSHLEDWQHSCWVDYIIGI